MHPLATLSSDLSVIPLDDLDVKLKPDGQYYRVYSWHIRATFISASTKYESVKIVHAKLVISGQSLGVVTCEYA